MCVCVHVCVYACVCMLCMWCGQGGVLMSEPLERASSYMGFPGATYKDHVWEAHVCGPWKAHILCIYKAHVWKAPGKPKGFPCMWPLESPWVFLYINPGKPMGFFVYICIAHGFPGAPVWLYVYVCVF